MPSDPQNKPERPDNVVALHRAEFVASIDTKLSEARRFFSLRDYASCAGLVQEVLAAHGFDYVLERSSHDTTRFTIVF